MKHYVLDPLFCFDPNDQQNRPIPEPGVDREQIWRRYPTRIRDLFTRSFTIGLHHPAERVVDAEWCEALAELEDHYFECPNCSQTRFIDEQRVTPCGNCGDLRATPALCVRGFHIVVRPGARISADRLRGDFDYGTVMAEVESHPTVEGLLGIKNLTLEEGGYLDPRGTTRALLPGKRAGLIEGAEVKLAGRRIRLVELRPDGDCCL